MCGVCFWLDSVCLLTKCFLMFWYVKTDWQSVMNLWNHLCTTCENLTMPKKIKKLFCFSDPFVIYWLGNIYEVLKFHYLFFWGNENIFVRVLFECIVQCNEIYVSRHCLPNQTKVVLRSNHGCDYVYDASLHKSNLLHKFFRIFE